MILTDDWPPTVGGVATWSSWAARALAEHHEVVVFGRARPAALQLPGVRFVPVRARSFARRGPFALAAAAGFDLRRADGVLCTTWPVARFASRVGSVHVVGHGSDLVRPSDSARLRRVWGRCAHGWTVSSHLASVAAERGLKAEVLPVPVPSVQRTPLGSRWVFVGRALYGKGGDRFVRWVAEAGVSADLVGEGPALPVWRALAARLGADVRFHGACSRAEVDQVYAGAGVVFLPSRTELAEGLGLTLLEARARGIPVVGTDSGGIREALGPEGLCVQPDLDGAELARRVRDLVRPAHPGGVDGFLRSLGAA